MLPVMIPRTPASGRFIPVPFSHDSQHSTSFSSTPSSTSSPANHRHSSYSTSSSSTSSSSSSSSSHLLHPRTLNYTPRTPSSTPSTKNLSSLHPTTPCSTSSSLSVDEMEVDQWTFHAESQIDRLIAQAEYVLTQQRQKNKLDGGEDDSAAPLTPWQERDVKDLLLKYNQLKFESTNAVEQVKREIDEEKQKTQHDHNPSTPISPAYSTSSHIALLQDELTKLQADFDAQRSLLLEAQAALDQHEALEAKLIEAQSLIERLESERDQLQIEVRSTRQEKVEVEMTIADIAGNMDYLKSECTREKQARERREREWEEEKEKRKVAEEELRRMKGREKVMMEEGERMKGKWRSAKKASERFKVTGVMSVMVVVLIVGVDRWMKEWVSAQSGVYTF